MFSRLQMTKIVSRTAAAITSAAILAGPVFAQEIPSESWMGIYLGDIKLGYARFAVDNAKFQGKDGYKLESTSYTRVLSLGEPVEISMETTIYLNKEFRPIYQLFDMSSAGHTTTTVAKFTDTEIIAELRSEGTKSTKTIPIPKGSHLVGESTFLPASMKLKVGDKITVRCFNPISITLDDLQIEVLRQEKLELGGKVYDTFVIKNLTPQGEMTSWQDANGDVLKVQAQAGMVMIREPQDVAQNLGVGGVYTPPADLAVMTSAPTTTDVPNPRQVRYMKVRLLGLSDKSLAISDRRQTVSLDAEKKVAEFEINASEFDPEKSVNLPVSGAEFERYLAETPYVQPNDPEIAQAAKDIVGSEKNAYRAAVRLRSWMRTNMQSKGNIGIVRSSVDVLRAKSGVCRDYAVLYAALARAIGIPTKMVAGLVYWKGGFFYHAWAESYVGEWIPIDPTLSSDFVDATHIKLSEGDANAMFDLVKAIGTLKAEILDFK